MEETARTRTISVTFAPKGVRALAAFTAAALVSPLAGFALVGAAGGLRTALVVDSVAFVLAAAARGVRIAVHMDDHGVRVVNYFRTRTVSWDRLSRVSLSSESFLVEGNQYGIKLTLLDGSSVLIQASLTLGRARSEMLDALRAYTRNRHVAFDLENRTPQ